MRVTISSKDGSLIYRCDGETISKDLYYELKGGAAVDEAELDINIFRTEFLKFLEQNFDYLKVNRHTFNTKNDEEFKNSALEIMQNIRIENNNDTLNKNLDEFQMNLQNLFPATTKNYKILKETIDIAEESEIEQKQILRAIKPIKDLVGPFTDESGTIKWTEDAMDHKETLYIGKKFSLTINVTDDDPDCLCLLTNDVMPNIKLIPSYINKFMLQERPNNKVVPANPNVLLKVQLIGHTDDIDAVLKYLQI